MQADAVRRWADELDAFEALLNALSGLRTRGDAERLREMVRLRPALAAQIVALREKGGAALADVCDPQLAEGYRARLSNLQRRVLLFQADWPALSVAARPEDYDRAAKALAEANRAFLAWARAMLAQAGQRAS